MVNGLAPGIKRDGEKDVLVVESDRRCRYCKLPAVNQRAPVAVQSMFKHSLPIQGAKIFNSLPRHLRDCTVSLGVFKAGLDDYLRSMLDQPYLPHYPSRTLSNSLPAVN